MAAGEPKSYRRTLYGTSVGPTLRGVAPSLSDACQCQGTEPFPSLPGQFALWSESSNMTLAKSLRGTFTPGNLSSLER